MIYQVYKWVPSNSMLGGWGVEILLVASCYRNRDKLRPDGPLGPNADLTLPFTFSWVCPVIDRKFRHNIVKVAVDPRGDSRVDP